MYLFFFLDITHYEFYYKVTLSLEQLRFIHLSIVFFVFVILTMIFKFYTDAHLHLKKSLIHFLRFYSITNRENDIITELLEGKTNQQIANELYIEIGTVKGHIQNIFRKFKVSSRAELLIVLMKKM